MTAERLPPPLPTDPFAQLPRLDRHQPRCGPVRPSRVGRWRALVLLLVHVAIGAHIWHWLATGRSLTPVEPSEAMQTLEEGRINAGFVLFLCLIAGTLVFGRFFCGWACHVVALQDLCAWLLARLGMKPKPVRSRLLVFAPWVVGGYMFVWPQVQHWLWPQQKPLPAVADWEWQLTTDELWRTFPGPLMAVATLLVCGFLVVWWLGAKGFCTYGCPYGAFFALADRLAPVRIKVTSDCNACGHCTHVCTSNVRVHEEVARHGQLVDPGCMKCLDCVSVCPKDALYVGFAWPQPFAVSQQRIRARGDFTWTEEVVLAVVAFATAEFGFRGAWFGEGVPLLLAVGLGVLTAVAAVALGRLWRQPEFALQGRPLRRGGRLTRGGWLLFALGGLWLAFAAHTLAAQHQKRYALALAQPPLRERLAERRAVEPARFTQALVAVEAGLWFDLADDPELLQASGLLRRELNQHELAERDLQRAIDKAPGLETAATALAIYRLRAGDLAAAERLARGVLDRHPDNRTAQALLQQVEAQRQK